MPTIDDYAPLEPFTLDEFVAACNAILRGRPSLQIQARTVRYYISTGLLPAPHGGPKYARYGIEHLKRVVAIRQWLDQGMSLEQAAERIKEGKHGGEPATVQRKQVFRSPAAPRPLMKLNASVREPSIQPEPDHRVRERTVRKLDLSEHCVLEVDADADLRQELENALEAIHNEIQNL